MTARSQPASLAPGSTPGAKPALDLAEYTGTVRAWFFKRYAPALADDGHDPEECLSAVWVGLLRNLHRFDPSKSKPEQYLAMRLRCLVTNWRRDQGRKLRGKMATGLLTRHRNDADSRTMDGSDGHFVDVGTGAVDEDAHLRLLDAVETSVDADPERVLEDHLGWVTEHYGAEIATRARRVASGELDPEEDRKAGRVLRQRLRFPEGEPMTPKEKADLDERFDALTTAFREMSDHVAALHERLDALVEAHSQGGKRASRSGDAVGTVDAHRDAEAQR